jgi:hypothetical protein
MKSNLFVYAGEPLIVALHHATDVIVRWYLNSVSLVVIVFYRHGPTGTMGHGLVECLLLDPK